MKKSELKAKIADILEIDPAEVTDDFDFSRRDEFDSMAVLGLIAFFSDSFGRQFTTAQLRGLTGLQSLMDLVGPERFEA
jgi:acyl carrier protein